jgi:hypothetical protein
VREVFSRDGVARVVGAVALAFHFDGETVMHRGQSKLPLLPLVLTVIISATAVVSVWSLKSLPHERVEARNEFLIESPMGRWISDGQPSAHLNGTVVFRESHTGDRIQIDNGGVVITPYRERR